MRMRIAALPMVAVMIAGCVSIEERMQRSGVPAGVTENGIQAVLMVSQGQVKRGRPLTLYFAIRNLRDSEVRIGTELTRDSGLAGLKLIDPTGQYPPFQDVLLKKSYVKVKDTRLLKTNGVHVATWQLGGNETRMLQPGFHAITGVYIGVKNLNGACDKWWEGRLESNPVMVQVLE